MEFTRLFTVPSQKSIPPQKLSKDTTFLMLDEHLAHLTLTLMPFAGMAHDSLSQLVDLDKGLE
jgi:hypothetical protein